MGDRGKEMHMPQQYMGYQTPENPSGGPDQNDSAPESKRRRMPATEGYHSRPAQCPIAQVGQKARSAERAALLPPPQLQIREPIPTSYQGPPLERVHQVPPQYIYTNGAPTDTGYVPQVTNAQSPIPTPAPPQAQAQQHAPSDMRNVQPADGQQSQSIHRALEYTRQVYRVFTSEEPPVTNLEDCYIVQYEEIWAAFRDWWGSEKNPNRAQPLPSLWRMSAWSGGLEDWKVS